MKTKDIFIDGGDIYLRPPQKKDVEGSWYTWLNDPTVTRFQNKGIFPNTYEKQVAYFNKIQDSDTDVIFAIIKKDTGEHIGSTGLHKIDWIHRSAELGIMIGEKKFWGKGFGKTVWNLITAYGFKNLNLHRIYSVIMSDNVASIKSAKASGFRVVGEIQDMFYKKGSYKNALYLSILENEFKFI